MAPFFATVISVRYDGTDWLDAQIPHERWWAARNKIILQGLGKLGALGADEEIKPIKACTGIIILLYEDIIGEQLLYSLLLVFYPKQFSWFSLTSIF